MIGWEIWNHKLLSLRAIVVGLAVMLTMRGVRGMVTEGAVMYWLFTFASFALAGWVVAQTHREYQKAMVSAFVLYALAAKAWLIASHFPVFWSAAEPHRLPIAVFLVFFGLICCLAGGRIKISPAKGE
jgi:hypothetical protein